MAHTAPPAAGKRQRKKTANHRRFRWLMVVSPLLLMLSALLAVMLGATVIQPAVVVRVIASHLPIVGGWIQPDWSTAEELIIWQVRLLRVALAACVGAGLALAGAAMQAMVRNALAEPYILGVSSGAAVGAALVMVLGLGTLLGGYGLAAAAFLGACAAVVLVFILAQVGGRITTTRLLLAGIALAMMLTALTNGIIMAAPDTNVIHDILFWMLGSLAGASSGQIALAAGAVLFVGVFLWLTAPWLNLLLMGDMAAAVLGLNVPRYRVALVLAISLLTGILVSMAGAIGFVGLMMPHIARLLVGADHRRMLPACAVLGAVFLILADTLARVLFAPVEIPIGIITALCGGPVFIWLLRRSNYQFGGGE